MPVSDKEKLWLEDLLIKDADNIPTLMHVARSITRNVCQIESAQEALAYLCTHLHDTNTLLNKRAMTKELLFKYLTRKRVSIRADFTKLTLINATLKFWQEHEPKSHRRATSLVAKAPTTLATEPITPRAAATPPPRTAVTPPARTAATPPPAAATTSTAIPASATTITIDLAHFPIHMLARQFTEWFFEKYNNSTLSCIDLWPDATLKMQIYGDNEVQQSECSGAEEVIEALLQSKQQLGVYFNPNLTHAGVQGRMDMHGLVLVLACGTLHTQQRCIGVFECAFGMMRDPFGENNWKPQSIQCRLRSYPNARMPLLMDCDALQDALSLPAPAGELT